MATDLWHRRLVPGLVVLCALLFSPVKAPGAQPSAEELIGTSVPIFALASSQNTLVDYQQDYYGKHHLILTFFPAAFTPV